MSETTDVVRKFYDTLEQGDLPRVIELVEEEVDWQSPVTRTHQPEIPWSSVRHNRQEVAAFFRELGQRVKPEGFELFETTAQDEREWVMVFSIRHQKIVRFRHYYDTADLAAALRAG